MTAYSEWAVGGHWTHSQQRTAEPVYTYNSVTKAPFLLRLMR